MRRSQYCFLRLGEKDGPETLRQKISSAAGMNSAKARGAFWVRYVLQDFYKPFLAIDQESDDC
jgi:hypothetical protein